MDFKALRQQMLDEEMAAPSTVKRGAKKAFDNSSGLCSAQSPHTSAKLLLTSILPIGSVPRASYVAEAVSADDEAGLLSCIKANGSRWVDLSARRLQEYGGKPTRAGLQNAEPLPPWLDTLATQLVESGLFPACMKPNHVLVNEYAPGEGILPHTDGPAYHPVVATLSLGSQAIMLYEEGFAAHEARGCGGRRACLEVLLAPRSIVVTSGLLYSHWLHSIPAEDSAVLGARSWPLDEEVDSVDKWVVNGVPGQEISRSGPRWSITIRHVPTPGLSSLPING